MSAYTAACLFVEAGGSPSPSGSSASPSLILAPLMFLYSALAAGARERFTVRLRRSLPETIAQVVAITGATALWMLSVSDVPYPWWLDLLAPIAIFGAVAAAPLRRLGTLDTPDDADRWSNRPLTVPARWTTVAVGIALGVISAAAASPRPHWASGAVMLATSVTMAVGRARPWGLASTGRQWGPAHWTLFIVATSGTLTVTALLARTSVLTATLAGTMAAISCASMAAAAFFPRRSSSQRSR